jgi:two-component system response regulator HydG
VAVNRGSTGHDAARAPASPASNTLDPFLGRSEVLGSFLESLRRAAQSGATVLIRGESGTGKTRAARLVHEWSPRAGGPFVSANLVATSSTLIEAALFGHERGAFTDAHRERAGLFRRAHGGTLVLHGVDHLPLEVQAKLLRVLQERVVEPLGTEAPIEVDVRVVATTTEGLERPLEQGRFRRDLYYRLAVVELELPPLRTRSEDVPLLAEHGLALAAGRVAVPVRSLTPGALERLQAHPWPGNVRELENALERVLVLGPPAPAPIEPGELDFLEEVRTGAADELARTALSLGLTLEAIERALLGRALAEQRGNVSAAARAVGLTRRAFDYRLAHGPGPASGPVAGPEGSAP